MISLQEIRRTFLDFFKRNDHTIVRSSPLIPHHDPSLLFTNAGMVQFKDIFTGQACPPYIRATTAQKCLRAGGKHNDLDNVGYTSRHHTFFEMLGNFSFGDYFKEEAICYAWEMITKVFCLDPKRLWVTVYAEDKETGNLWKKHIAQDRILEISTSDNFWMMGDTGPCGPCSEIFYDHGAHIPGGLPGTPEQDGDRFIEIWNLVFMQYEQKPDGQRISLPKPSIDTGMGLERITAVLQGVHDNYDTDLFVKLIQNSIQRTQKEPHQSHRVIADHLRACSFLIADGILPSNEGRGYVLRRIMRRAMRHAYLLGAQEALMWKLVPVLVSEMGNDYPELTKAQSLIQDAFKAEEERFRQTLEKGIKLLQEETNHLASHENLKGDVAFKLYDTYGFPLDLTQDILRQQNREVNLEEFENCMAIQKETARAHWCGSGEKTNDEIWKILRDQIPETHFLGYEKITCEARILALIDMNGNLVDELKEGWMITDQTPFYGESGGQKGDHGVFQTTSSQGHIKDTLKKFHLIAHYICCQDQPVRNHDAVSLIVDSNRRQALARYHSATHLLHSCLRHVLGDHVTQKGSLVDAHRLRFDFSHFSALTSEQIEQVEDCMNKSILRNIPVHTDCMSYEDALASQVTALFGEKYGDTVRVVEIGKHSKELCGGTHVKYTGEIGLVHITNESSVSAGVRRIEAVTGQDLISHIRSKRKAWAIEKEKEKGSTKPSLKKPLDHYEFENLQIHDTPLYVLTLNDTDTKQLKTLCDQQKTKIQNGIIIASSVKDGRISFVVSIKDLPFNAIDIVRYLSQLCDGTGGGGRPDMAQGGGTKPFKDMQKAMLDFLHNCG